MSPKVQEAPVPPSWNQLNTKNPPKSIAFPDKMAAHVPRILIGRGYQGLRVRDYINNYTIDPAAMPEQDRLAFFRSIRRQGSNSGFQLRCDNEQAPDPTTLAPMDNLDRLVVPQLALLGRNHPSREKRAPGSCPWRASSTKTTHQEAEEKPGVDGVAARSVVRGAAAVCSRRMSHSVTQDVE
ncbi:hypothetical protein V3481_006818 [Fusarium oxysporum f. sp. vasinfectum]